MRSNSIGNRPTIYHPRNPRFLRSGVVTREMLERRERRTLSPYATLSTYPPVSTVKSPHSQTSPRFAEEKDKIVSSSDFREMAGKTQVFIRPKKGNATTRLFHTMTVDQLSRTVGRALGLNEDLIEVIALGHDLGHTPFGHAGERALSELAKGHLGNRYSFSHNRNSFRIAKKYRLSFEVLDGILRHSGFPDQITEPSQLDDPLIKHEGKYPADKILYLSTGRHSSDASEEYLTYLKNPKVNPLTLEGCLVKVMDKVASVVQDYYDLLCAELVMLDEPDPSKLPETVALCRIMGIKPPDKPGSSFHRSFTAAICDLLRIQPSDLYSFSSYDASSSVYRIFQDDIIENSWGRNAIAFSKDAYAALYLLDWFIEGIEKGYHEILGQRIEGSRAIQNEDEKAKEIIRVIFDWALNNPASPFRKPDPNALDPKNDKRLIVFTILDFIAGMTDHIAIEWYENITGKKAPLESLI